MSIGGPADGQNINGSEKPVFYPNPTYGQLQISLPAGTSALCNIYDLGGRNVLQFHASDDIKDIDISSLTKGLYCVTLQSEGKISTQKIILQ
jgi:hypothetical protein